jgi:hypothetical protein
MWEVSERNQIQAMLMDEVDKGCPDKGCSDSCGCLCRRQDAPVLDANVSKPIHACYSSFFIVFSFKKLIKGHCPGMVTSGGNVTHKRFHGNEKVGS